MLATLDCFINVGGFTLLLGVFNNLAVLGANIDLMRDRFDESSKQRR